MSKILSFHEIELILIQARPLPSSYYWSAVIGTMAYAGLRDVEIIALLAEDVDLAAGLIKVRSIENASEFREVPITPKLLYILQLHPYNASEYLFSNIQANGKKWYKSSFDTELKKRLPNDVEANDLTDSFSSL